jgi:DNA-directed RNA polymerase subunit RPC12/RpoP
VAYVDPPPRPGAVLWSIAAGPLVNVALYPLLSLGLTLAVSRGWPTSSPDAWRLLFAVCWINRGLLIFNLLPIYPLDGGQILQSLLWFVLGRARSLAVAAIIGSIGALAAVAWAVHLHSIWIGVIAIFILMNCWRGLRAARVLTRLDRAPRHEGFACPACRAAPPQGALWKCNRCGTAFDTFLTHAKCPKCGAQFDLTRCVNCGQLNPIEAWPVNSPAPPVVTDN